MTQEDTHDASLRPSWKKLFSTVPFFILGTPTNPNRVLVGYTEPEGLTLVHCAATTAEADLLRQILEDAGFRPEYVSSVGPGGFGTSGSPYVCVPAEEGEEARRFIAAYYAESIEDDIGEQSACGGRHSGCRGME